VELTLRQEFERWLDEDKKVLMAKYDAEVDELRAAQDAENKKRDAKVQELVDHRESDFEKYDAELGVWRARDRKIHTGLQGMEDALHGSSLLPLRCFRSIALLPFLLATLAGAFPNSAAAAVATAEECQAEYHIVRPRIPKLGSPRWS
jgi:hypothetical protein